MNPAEYTPDAICRSMGLPGFVEARWSPVTLRLLLMPSFDPEVCITLGRAGRADGLSVAALAERLWLRSAPFPIKTWREQVVVPTSVFDEAVASFSAALVADRQPEGRMVCIDGMPVAACLRSETGLEQLACSPYRPAVSAFVSRLVRTAWEKCRVAQVRNALAACGRYIGIDLPHEPAGPSQNLYRITVLGTPDERAVLMGALRDRHTSGTARPTPAD